jgi:hypothetical protein
MPCRILGDRYIEVLGYRVVVHMGIHLMGNVLSR